MRSTSVSGRLPRNARVTWRLASGIGRQVARSIGAAARVARIPSGRSRATKRRCTAGIEGEGSGVWARVARTSPPGSAWHARDGVPLSVKVRASISTWGATLVRRPPADLAETNTRWQGVMNKRRLGDVCHNPLRSAVVIEHDRPDVEALEATTTALAISGARNLTESGTPPACHAGLEGRCSRRSETPLPSPSVSRSAPLREQSTQHVERHRRRAVPHVGTRARAAGRPAPPRPKPTRHTDTRSPPACRQSRRPARRSP